MVTSREMKKWLAVIIKRKAGGLINSSSSFIQTLDQKTEALILSESTKKKK